MSKTPIDFIGQEVACRTFGRFIIEWQKKGLSLEALVAGSGCSVEDLCNKHARMSWASYCAITANARTVWDDDGFVELGLIVMDSPWAKPFTIPARLLYSVNDFYHAMVRPGTGTGIARQMFTCVAFRLYDVDPSHIVLETTMEDGYPVCREFFLITKGSLISIPTMLGLEMSKVEMEEIDAGVRFDIRLPAGGGTLAGLRRALTWPFTARAVARELEEAYAELHASHAHLEVEMAERRRVEEEREYLIADLEANNVELAFRNAELERFTYTVSHDLKTPLVTIKGFLGLLEQDAATGDTERMQHDIDRVSYAADKMARLLDELLELSRIGRLMNLPEPVDLTELAREAVSLVAGQIVARGVAVEIDPTLPLVYGDPVRLLEVYQNLIDNAVKFMGRQPEPRIEIGVRHEGKEAVCFVRDNGIGIDPKYHENVFGLFNRLDPYGEGTGIGLALVRRIVEVHGGKIWVESGGAGQGSTFYFILPSSLEHPSKKQAVA